MKTRSIIILVATLIIGFIVGFIISAQLSKKRIEKMVMLGMEQGFSRRVYQTLDLTETQKKELGPVIHKYAKKNAEITHDFRLKLKEQFDSFDTEIVPYLNENQKEKLNRIKEHRRRPPSHMPGKRHNRPGKGMGPGHDERAGEDCGDNWEDPHHYPPGKPQGGGFMRIQRVLHRMKDLSPEVSDSIININELYREQFLKAVDTIYDRDDIWEIQEELLKKRDEGVKTLLSPEQQNEFDEIMEFGGKGRR